MSGTAEPEPEAVAPPQQTPRSHHQTTKAANTSENFEEDPSFATRTIALFFLHLPVVFMFGMCFTEMGYGATVQKGALRRPLARSQIQLVLRSRGWRPERAARRGQGSARGTTSTSTWSGPPPPCSSWRTPSTSSSGMAAAGS